MDTKQGADRRQFLRLPISFLVQYRSDTFEQFLAEYASNLSLGGMFIKTREPREVGTLIYFQFLLKDGSKLIEGLGKVVWVSRNTIPSADVQEGMGVEFLSLDTESLKFIEDIIDTGASH